MSTPVLLVLFLLLASVLAQSTVTVNRYAGVNFQYDETRPADATNLQDPSSLAIDPDRKLIYIAVAKEHLIRVLDITTKQVSLLAGNGSQGYSDNKDLRKVNFNTPFGLELDTKERLLYVADTHNCAIRVIDLKTNTISLFAGTPYNCTYGGDNQDAKLSQLDKPMRVWADTTNNMVYITDSGNNCVRRVNRATGIISLFAGVPGPGNYSGDGGLAVNAKLFKPVGIAIDPTSGAVFICDSYNQRIRVVRNGIISTFAGNGTRGYTGNSGLALNATLRNPYQVYIEGKSVFIVEAGNHVIRVVDTDTNIISTYAGTGSQGEENDDGPATLAQLSFPADFTATPSTIYIADVSNAAVRAIDRSTGIISTLVARFVDNDFTGDNGIAKNATFEYPTSLVFDTTRNLAYITDFQAHTVRVIDQKTGKIKTVAGQYQKEGYSGDGGLATNAQLYGPGSVAIDSTKNLLYIADSTNNVIRVVDLNTNIISTYAGMGWYGDSGDNEMAINATMRNPFHLALDTKNDLLYFSDAENYVIRVIDRKTGIITKVAGTYGESGNSGDGGAATSAVLGFISHIAIDTVNNVLLLSDWTQNVVRAVDRKTGLISTFAGNDGEDRNDGGKARDAYMSSPSGVAIDSARGLVYITEYAGGVVRVVEQKTGIINTFAGDYYGSGAYSGDGGNAKMATFSGLFSPAFDANGVLYVVDSENALIRSLIQTQPSVSSASQAALKVIVLVMLAVLLW